ncbi:Lsr2 dimerization domain-containing protein [Psychromicrobium lacuslunae]|uniref:Lsr2 dimerization domain-containing protein n=1 Tax=Psychromicrobium lacuslunae TaxID=1618207 RepID=A0A0D4C1B8_9MICC|nr:histone-like nucleoid-structuring protein Lsr2 [Psychromicrobium lacuslunae]AJT42487.1 hypothetical protein UM93_15095 [Psychromicrobium lacuslunae]
MAQREVIEHIDDLTGEVVDDVRTVRFGFEGLDYEIDLSGANASEFMRILAPYLRKSRRVRRARQGASNSLPASEVPVTVKRSWLLENGFAVSKAGRMKLEHHEAYAKAHS